MKLKATSFVLGICLAVLAGAASLAYARGTTGFSAFKVWEQGVNQYKNPLGCLTESFGAVVNNCTFAVNLEFDLPIDSAGIKSIDVQNFWDGTAKSGAFTCESVAYAGNGPQDVAGTFINFTGPGQSLITTVNVSAAMSVQLVCYNVPPKGGIANINWNP